uniref:Uncharacterized protein n=1 Tax=Anguilla anguilla TaxID=7936 RepID=A0A0E9PIL2_ANGAN
MNQRKVLKSKSTCNLTCNLHPGIERARQERK